MVLVHQRNFYMCAPLLARARSALKLTRPLPTSRPSRLPIAHSQLLLHALPVAHPLAHVLARARPHQGAGGPRRAQDQGRFRGLVQAGALFDFAVREENTGADGEWLCSSRTFRRSTTRSRSSTPRRPVPPLRTRRRTEQGGDDRRTEWSEESIWKVSVIVRHLCGRGRGLLVTAR